MSDPLVQLADDRVKARAASDPWANLCVLATVDASGNPQARVIVLRDLEDRLAVFINGTSPKHAELSFSTHHTVLIYLASLGVQYRLMVTFDPVQVAIVHRSWLDRPRIPKVMDWFYERMHAQSSEVPSRDYLEDRFAELDAQLPKSIDAPQHALGYFLTVVQVERLQLAGDRVHSRRCYQRDATGWRAIELIP